MSKFNDDRARVIDLLYRNYYSQIVGENKRPEGVVVKIYYEELQSYGMDYDLFCEIIRIFEKESVVRIIGQYEYDDTSFGTQYGNVPREEVPCIAEIEFPDNFDDIAKKYLGAEDKGQPQGILKSKTHLRSIHLVTSSLEPQDVIFLVLDGNYHLPIRFIVKNSKGGSTYIKKLFDIAYLADAPGKKVAYNKGLADNINNGLFRKRPVKKYMRTNKFEKPTLVQKSEDKKNLVLKNEIQIEMGLIKNIPVQYQHIYKDKTK